RVNRSIDVHMHDRDGNTNVETVGDTVVSEESHRLCVDCGGQIATQQVPLELGIEVRELAGTARSGRTAVVMFADETQPPGIELGSFERVVARRLERVSEIHLLTSDRHAALGERWTEVRASGDDLASFVH